MKYNWKLVCEAILAILLVAGSLQARVKPWVTAYVGDWWLGWNGNSGQMPTYQINFRGMTVCDYMAIGPSSTSPYIDTTDNAWPLTTLADSAHAHGVKVTATVGSWNTATRFDSITASTANTQAFISALVSFIKKCNIDGVDIDWEPLPNQDVPHWQALIRELRQALPSPKYLITVTSGNGFPYFAYPAIQDDVDQINLMTYDIGYPARGFKSGFSGAIYTCGATYNGQPIVCCNTLVGYLEQAGVKPSKIGIGCEPGGELWVGISGPGQDTTPLREFKADVPYTTIMSTYYNPSLYHWDACAGQAYLSYDSTNSSDSTSWFLSYDDTTMLKAKLKYVESAGIGGVIIYEIGMSYDKRTGENPFLKATEGYLDDRSFDH